MGVANWGQFRLFTSWIQNHKQILLKNLQKTRKVSGSHGALDNLVSHLSFAYELLATEAV